MREAVWGLKSLSNLQDLPPGLGRLVCGYNRARVQACNMTVKAFLADIHLSVIIH